MTGAPSQRCPSDDGDLSAESMALDGWLRDRLPSPIGALEYQRVAGGQSNVTILVTDSGSNRWVLRRPPDDAAQGAHDVVREARILEALHPTDVPVPEMIAVEESLDVLGVPFYVMEYIPGVIHHTREHAQNMTPAQRRRTAEGLVATLASLHRLDPLPAGLARSGSGEDHLSRQLHRWNAQYEASGLDVPEIPELRSRLAADAPRAPGTTVVHGDYRPGNIVHRSDGSVAAVLDWEICTIGDPLVDLSHLLITWVEHDGDDPHLDSATWSAGFPPAGVLLDWYAAETAADLDRIHYYLGFAAWRMACMLNGLIARKVRGGATQPTMNRAHLTDLRSRFLRVTSLELELDRESSRAY